MIDTLTLSRELTKVGIPSAHPAGRKHGLGPVQR